MSYAASGSNRNKDRREEEEEEELRISPGRSCMSIPNLVDVSAMVSKCKKRTNKQTLLFIQ
jgi:hypothetical protein